MLPLVALAHINLPLHMTLYLDGGYWAQPIPNYSDTQGDVDPIIPPTRRAPPVDPSSFNIPFISFPILVTSVRPRHWLSIRIMNAVMVWPASSGFPAGLARHTAAPCPAPIE
jgi:hypothetical protein